MNQSTEVVITGIGTVSPLGIGNEPLWEALLQGRSGIARLPDADAMTLPFSIGGRVPEFEPKAYVKPRKSLKVMSHEIQLGYVAASMAIEGAELDAERVDSHRFGVVFASDMMYCPPAEVVDAFVASSVDGAFDMGLWGEKGLQQFFPLWMLKYLPNMVASHIGIRHDARGPSNCISAGDVSSLLAIIEAAAIIQRGDADVMLAGGVGNRLNTTSMLYRGDANVSPRSDDPAAVSRPFDADRDGMVNSEGAGAFLLESRTFAERRGAPILARICAAGRHCATAQSDLRNAVAQSVRTALMGAGWSVDDVGHVNAHGLSTIEADRTEAAAIRDTLGDVAVTAPKSFFGNLGSGAGAVELAVSLLGLREKLIPPTLNYATPDPDCPIAVVSGEPQPERCPTALALSQAGTGQAVALAVAAET